MIASQRTWHYRIWLLVAPLVLAGLVAAIVMRRPAPVQETPVADVRAGGGAPP